jgi:hypothetical protein
VELGLPVVERDRLIEKLKIDPARAQVAYGHSGDVELVGLEIAGGVDRAILVDPRAAEEARPVVGVPLDDLEGEAGPLSTALD